MAILLHIAVPALLEQYSLSGTALSYNKICLAILEYGAYAFEYSLLLEILVY